MLWDGSSTRDSQRGRQAVLVGHEEVDRLVQVPGRVVVHAADREALPDQVLARHAAQLRLRVDLARGFAAAKGNSYSLT